MKSFFLEGLSSYAEAREVLSARLPHWVEPWLLNGEGGDTIAFFTLEQGVAGQVAIQADLSGRHYSEAETVIGVLGQLQDRLGGRVTDDDENVIS